MARASIKVLFLITAVLSGCDTVEELPQSTPAPRPVVKDKAPPSEPPRDFMSEMLLTKPLGDWPEAAPVLTWFESLEEGWAEVKKEGRPMLVLVSCPGSTKSGQFAEDLLNPTPEMATLLRQFVTVHLTDGQKIDLNRMPFRRYQDPDQTWWCWILSPEAQVYSVLGKISPESPEITWEHALEWMTSVLNHHWDPRRPEWNADGEAVPSTIATRSIAENSGFQKWKAGAEYLGDLKNNGQCICCHQMQDILWVEKDLAKKFRMKNDYWIWPPAKKIGVGVVDEVTPELTQVEADSIFANELKVADRFGVLKGKRVFSSTEFRALLNAYQDREFIAIDKELHRPSLWFVEIKSKSWNSRVT